MRISADKNDPDYCPDSRFKQIYLDGEFVKHVVSADDACGVIECWQTDRYGEPVIVGGEILYQTRRGIVEIKDVRTFS